MRKFSILALTATLAITPAFAEMTHHYNTPNVDTQALVTQPQADLSFAFDNSENLQAVAMTDKQMQDTEGAFAPLAYYGAVYGVPLTYAGMRWLNSPAPQIWYHNIRQRF